MYSTPTLKRCRAFTKRQGRLLLLIPYPCGLGPYLRLCYLYDHLNIFVALMTSCSTHAQRRGPRLRLEGYDQCFDRLLIPSLFFGLETCVNRSSKKPTPLHIRCTLLISVE